MYRSSSLSLFLLLLKVILRLGLRFTIAGSTLLFCIACGVRAHRSAPQLCRELDCDQNLGSHAARDAELCLEGESLGLFKQKVCYFDQDSS